MNMSFSGTVVTAETRTKQILNALMPGQFYRYHTGSLPRDRARSVDVGVTARVCWNQQRDGLVMLAQKRLGPFEFEYRAYKCTEPTAIKKGKLP